MNDKSPKLKVDSQTYTVRQNIKAQVVELGNHLEDSDSGDIDRRSKALITLFKFTQIIDAQDAQDLLASAVENEKAHTPYDQIPPPNEEEMRIIQDRLNRLYNRVRTAEDPRLIFEGDEEE